MAGRLTAQQIYAYARQGGFSGSAAVTATAVALAESGGNPSSVGDVNLTTAGERSVGLWQVNYRPGRDGNDSTRDPGRNLDPAFNAQAAYAISGQGKSFRPWSTYTSGAYRRYLPAALAAAGGHSATTAPAPVAAAAVSSRDGGGSGGGLNGSFTDGFGIPNILGIPSLGDLGNAAGTALSVAGSGIVAEVSKAALYLVFVLGGVTLVGGGVYKAATGRSKPTPIPIPV